MALVDGKSGKKVTRKRASKKPQEKNVDKYNFDPNKVYVVVHGKPKEIRKSSQYLLDMLVIDED